MGLLVAYSAAMHRVLIGLECTKLYDLQDIEGQCEAEEAAAAAAAEGRQDDHNDASKEKARVAARVAAFSPLSARLARHCRASIPAEALRELCNHNGEFDGYARTFSAAVDAHCDSVCDDRLMDEAMDYDLFLQAAKAATRRLEAGGVSRAALRRPETLEMILLSTAHKIATRMRTKAVRKGA